MKHGTLERWGSGALVLAILFGPLACAEKKADQSATVETDAPVRGFSKTPVEEVVKTPMIPMDVAKMDRTQTPVPSSQGLPKHELPDVHFSFDRWGLSQEGMKALNEEAAVLKQHPGATLIIEGYCDERGSPEYNLVLGDKRAQEARRYLTALGVKNPVKVISYGKERPVCREADESCYWKNRRAHLVVEEGQ